MIANIKTKGIFCNCSETNLFNWTNPKTFFWIIWQAFLQCMRMRHDDKMNTNYLLPSSFCFVLFCFFVAFEEGNIFQLYWISQKLFQQMFCFWLGCDALCKTDLFICLLCLFMRLKNGSFSAHFWLIFGSVCHNAGRKTIKSIIPKLKKNAKI